MHLYYVSIPETRVEMCEQYIFSYMQSEQIPQLQEWKKSKPNIADL
jgi:hypothetical protein